LINESCLSSQKKVIRITEATMTSSTRRLF
jgi:hypothetical protein